MFFRRISKSINPANKPTLIVCTTTYVYNLKVLARLMMSCHDKVQCLQLHTDVEMKYEEFVSRSSVRFVKMLLQTLVCHWVLSFPLNRKITYIICVQVSCLRFGERVTLQIQKGRFFIRIFTQIYRRTVHTFAEKCIDESVLQIA